MNYSDSIWLVFLLIGLATTLPRASFIIFGNRIKLPDWLKDALRFVPAAALAAIVVPDVILVSGEVAIFNPKLAAAAVAAVAVMVWRNAWLPFIGGMATLLVLRHYFA